MSRPSYARILVAVEHFQHALEELRDAAAREPLEFAKLFQRHLAADFDAAFDHVKVQKLLLKRRSTAWIRDLEKEMDVWLAHAPLKGKLKAQVRRHISVCAAVQEVLETIDKSASSLRIWQASTRDLLLSLIAWVEDRRFDGDSGVKAGGSSAGLMDGLQQMELSRRDLRSHCDYITQIINQVSRVGVVPVGTIELSPSDADVREAVRLAALADLVLHVLDCYTYKSFRVSVGTKRIEMHGLKSQIEEAQAWSALRDGSRQLVDVHASNLRIKDVEELAQGLSCNSELFSSFLEGEIGQRIFQALRPHRVEYARILKRDVNELIDLTFLLRTHAGAFRAEDLLEYWSLLWQIALCAYIWRQVFKKRSLPVLPLASLSSLSIASLGCTAEEAGRLMSQFLLDPAKRNQDPFFRPLIKLGREECVVARTFIESGRFSRNLFTIAIREGGVDFSAKGLKPLQTLRDEFLNARYQVVLNLPVVASDRVVTDIDIAAAKDGFLFVGQTKVLINPDTVYDNWKVLENLRRAAGQLRKSLPYVSVLAGRFGLRDGEYLTVPFLLTNLWDFTGATVGGFKVVDFSYLSFLLRGAEVWGVQLEPVPTREIHKLIAGRYPTGEDLSRLLLKPMHEAMFHRAKLERRYFTVGEWTITVPVDVSKAPDGDVLARMTGR
jgi:hypothetical protein